MKKRVISLVVESMFRPAPKQVTSTAQVISDFRVAMLLSMANSALKSGEFRDVGITRFTDELIDALKVVDDRLTPTVYTFMDDLRNRMVMAACWGTTTLAASGAAMANSDFKYSRRNDLDELCEKDHERQTREKNPFGLRGYQEEWIANLRSNIALRPTFGGRG